MSNRIRSMVSGFVMSLLKLWPHDELVQAQRLINAELKRRSDLDNNDYEARHSCRGHNHADTEVPDDDIDESGFNPEELNSIASKIYEPAVPGTVKELFYDVWVEFNDLVSTKYQQIRSLEKICDTLALTHKSESDLFKQLERDSEEKLETRIVKLPILNQDQLDTLLEAEPKINQDGWNSAEGKMMFGTQVFTLTHSLIVD